VGARSVEPESDILDVWREWSPFEAATIADINCAQYDFTVRVTVPPSHGMVLKEDGITQVGLGQMVTAAELAAAAA
jgi:hypothetical protein